MQNKSMADIRAEILAASRSCTGWMEGYNQSSEHQPFISKVKSTFEEKIQENLEKSANSTKCEPVRRRGTKVSTIANLFQSLSPQKGESTYNSKTGSIPSRKQEKQGDSKGCERSSDQDNLERHTLTDQNGTANSESYVVRFNTAKAMFERLEEENRRASGPGSVRHDSSSSQSSSHSSYVSSHNFLSHGPTKSAFPASSPNVYMRHFQAYTDHKMNETDEQNFKQGIEQVADGEDSSASLDDLSSADFSEEILREDKKLNEDICRQKSHSKIIPVMSKESTEVSASYEEKYYSESSSTEQFQLDCNRNTSCEERSTLHLSSPDFNIQGLSNQEPSSVDVNVHSIAINRQQKYEQSNNDNEQNISSTSRSSSFLCENDFQTQDGQSSLHSAVSSDLLNYMTESSPHKHSGVEVQNGGNSCLDYIPDEGRQAVLSDPNQKPYEVTLSSNQVLYHSSDFNKYITEAVGNDFEKSDSGIDSAIIDNTTKTFAVTDSVQKKKNIPSDKITLSSEAVVNYDTATVSLMSDWMDLELSDPRRWSSSASPEHAEDHDSESESPCDAIDCLRDAAGETLAEFECRENELFFVEAVLDSEDQSSESGRFPSLQLSETSDGNLDFMTREEAENLLRSSIRQDVDEEDSQSEAQFSHHNGAAEEGAESWKTRHSANEEEDLSQEAECDIIFPPGTNILYEDTKYHILPGGHFVTELPGLEDDSEDDETIMLCPIPPRKKAKVKFSTDPIKMFSTYSVEEYDRRNEEVDPVAASAEYELEKRIEKMDVFPVELMKGPEGLGLSIIGMGVGADAGLEKLGIFVKSVTEGGASCRDGRIQVNDQIIEVDGKSLVGVTQAYAASVLRNTSGLVRFLIGRERDSTNSEIAHLISQSLQTDKEQPHVQQTDSPRKDLQLPLCSHKDDHRLDSCDSSHLSQGSTPEEGEDAPTVEVFDLTSGSSGSLSPDTDMETLRVKLKEAQYRNAVTEAELRHVKEKLQTLENAESENQKYVNLLASALEDARDKEILVENIQKEAKELKQTVEKMKEELVSLERKYNKAKKIIKEFQTREKDFLQQEEYHLQQLQEKDQEYNSLVKTLKDRVILLERTLTETQKAENLPLQLPYDNIKQYTPQKIKKFHKPLVKPALKQIEVDMSEGEFSDSDLSKCDISPYMEAAEEHKKQALEKKTIREETFSQAQPLPDLLEASAGIAFTEDDSRSGSMSPQPIVSPSDSELRKESTLTENISGLKSYDASLHQHFYQTSLSGMPTTPHLMASDKSPTSQEPSLSSDASLNISCKQNLTFAEEIKVAVLEWQTKVTSPVDESKEDARLKQEKTVLLCEASMELVSPDRPHHIEISARATQDLSALQQASQPLPCSKLKGDSNVNVQDTRQAQNMSGGSLKSKPDHKDPGKDAKTVFSSNTKTSKMSGSTSQNEGTRSSIGDRYSHHWQGRPVHLWTTAQVGQWLMALGLKHHIRSFQDDDVTGQQLLHLDSSRLKALGVVSSSDRSTLKKKIKELKSQLEKERKAHEKEQKARERQQKKAEKASRKK